MRGLQAAAGRSMRLRFGDLVLDPDARQLFRGSRELRLGPRSFDLLELLARSRPRALRKAEIQRHLWPDAAVGPHDVTLCAHAMYGAADFAGFVRGLERVTRRHVFLLMRAPEPDGVMAEAARRVLGHPHDSPNFQVGYNALLQLGVFPDVVVEEGRWEPWRHASLEEALAEVKRRLGLAAASPHDAFLAELLERRLARTDDGYVWPHGTRSALAHWDVERYRVRG